MELRPETSCSQATSFPLQFPVSHPGHYQESEGLVSLSPLLSTPYTITPVGPPESDERTDAGMEGFGGQISGQGIMNVLEGKFSSHKEFMTTSH